MLTDIFKLAPLKDYANLQPHQQSMKYPNPNSLSTLYSNNCSDLDNIFLDVPLPLTFLFLYLHLKLSSILLVYISFP